jgi:hypothetical protein
MAIAKGIKLDREAVELAGMVWRASGLTSAPLDIGRVARALGIVVVVRDLPKPIRAVSDLYRRVIILSSRYPVHKRRFHFGHEVAELLTIDLDLPHSSWQNQFSGHLLVPLLVLIQELQRGMGMDDLCRIFGVGRGVILYQLKLIRHGIGISETAERWGGVVRSGSPAVGSVAPVQHANSGDARGGWRSRRGESTEGLAKGPRT